MEQAINPVTTAESTGFPWLLFGLGETVFALNSRRVTGIQILPPNIEKMPDAPSCIRGIYSLRGTIVPLLDLRMEFGIATMEQEMDEFITMLDQRRQDHINWVHELRRCGETGDPFLLSTDPHKCAFGKWRDSFVSKLESINYLLKRIDEPHAKLHDAGAALLSCSQQHELCQRPTCLKKVLEEAENTYVPAILSILDEMKVAFKDSFREMVIVLEFDGKQVGVIVDEVMAVENLDATMTNDKSMRHFADQQFVLGVSKSPATDKMVLMVDEQALCSLFCVV